MYYFDYNKDVIKGLEENEQNIINEKDNSKKNSVNV